MSRRDRDREYDRQNDRRRSRSNDRRRDDRGEDRKRSRKNDSPPIQSRQVIDIPINKYEKEEQWNGRERGSRQGFEGKRADREPMLCRYYQQGLCKFGNSCQFSHNGLPGVDMRGRGREFQNHNHQSNFNQENGFSYFNPNIQMHPLDNEVQFHANAFLEQLQQPQNDMNNNTNYYNTDNNNIKYIDSDDDDDEKDESNIETNPKVWALEDSSLLISKHLAGQVLFEKVMKLRSIEGNESAEKQDDNVLSYNSESGGLDDLLASISANNEEKNESSVDDLFALMGNDASMTDKNDNKNSSFHMEDDNNEENETKIDDDNESKDEQADDDMYGDLYGDLGGQDADDDETEVVEEPAPYPDNNTNTNEDNTNLEVNSNDHADNDKAIIKHTIRKEIPFYLQNVSYDRLNIFNNAQGGQGLVNLLDKLPSLLKMNS